MTIAIQTAVDSSPAPAWPRLLRVGLRYGLSVLGPAAVSGAHFVAALVFFRSLAAREFGLFSFVLIIVSFAMSISGALLVIPVSASLKARGEPDQAVAATCLKLNLVFTAAAGGTVCALLLASHCRATAALLLGLFSAGLTYRWFARCYAYVHGRIAAAVASDLIYALSALGGILALVLLGHVSLEAGAGILLLAALAGVAPFGRDFFARQWRAIGQASLRGYIGLWRDLTRWSLLGVVFTEMTVNAHAYLVTFISGPGAFALLALGMLLMRPISLIQSALPDMERPIMTRAIAAGDMRTLRRTVREFRYGLAAAWLGTVLLAGALLHWFPGLVLKKGYDMRSVTVITILCAIIMAVRTLRGPLAVWLQAAGEFKALAGIGTRSSVISIAATLLLLLAFGPIASLGGVLLGELVVLASLYRLIHAWECAHA